MIGDNHLSRINKSRFKNDDIEHTVYFKWFSGSTKQLNYYANPPLGDEQPNTVIVHIGSNDITKFNYNKVDVEDLAQRIIDVGKKCKSYGVINIAISSILVQKNHEVNEVIRKVNNLLKTLWFNSMQPEQCYGVIVFILQMKVQTRYLIIFCSI